MQGESKIPSDVVNFYSVTDVYFDDGMVWVRGNPVDSRTLGDVFTKIYLDPSKQATSPFKFQRVGNLFPGGIPVANIIKPGDPSVVIQPKRSIVDKLSSNMDVNFSIATALNGGVTGAVTIQRKYQLDGIYFFTKSGLTPDANYCAHPNDYWYVRAIDAGSLAYVVTADTTYKASWLGIPGNDIKAAVATDKEDTKDGGLILELASLNDVCAPALIEAVRSKQQIAEELVTKRDSRISAFRASKVLSMDNLISR